jgi:UDP-N-acetylglucosamine 2-epimerase (non-hydrolysing)/GDP/UDP-N,N'-diacetylbacillosamine 2-epimerase (hydrolysing)
LNAPRTVAVFTANRAEYGLLYSVIQALGQAAGLDCKLIVSGAHLDDRFGSTQSEIDADGISISYKVAAAPADDSLAATARAIANGVDETVSALTELQPDWLLVYGDRFETFAAAIAGTQLGIPTAHLEGGDLTEGGALDDSVRHAISKLAHVHFPTNQQARNRLLAMGEEAWRINTISLPSLDSIKAGDFCSQSEVITRLQIDPAKPIVLFTQHSIATRAEDAGQQIAASLEALEILAAEGVQILITYPNNDAGSQVISDAIEVFAAESSSSVTLSKSLGRRLYHGVLALARNSDSTIVCAGNSSSSLKETPVFGCPSVNIGPRQDGRLRAENVIDAPHETAAIEQALRTALFDNDFRIRCREVIDPYGNGASGKTIAEVLSNTEMGATLIAKRCTLSGQEKDGWYQ